MADWPPLPAGGFGLSALPYGVDRAGHVVVALGDSVIDLAQLSGLDVGGEVWTTGSLAELWALGPPAWTRTRQQLRELLGPSSQPQPRALRPRHEVQLGLAWDVADYVDFYASEAHASAMGRLMRPGTDPLPPAWRHLPIGYHGRASGVVASGSAVPRPRGLLEGEAGPVLAATGRLDVEVELGFVVGTGSPRGERIDVAHATEHIFGVVVVNDWSARDIQAFEYRPLGPMQGKSFATSVSAWVLPLVALEPWRVDGPTQSPSPAPHLVAPEPRNFDIHLELDINNTVVSTTSASGLYWSVAQQLAHLSSNGAAVSPGDLLASGTISGWGPSSAGSLMELTDDGRQPLSLNDGTIRSWVQDGDTVVIRGWCGDRGKPGEWMSLGEVAGTVLPAGEELS